MHDNDRIHSTLASDPDFAELVQEFVADMPSRVAIIRKSMAERDLVKLRRAIHQLRGACGGYGFHTLSPMAGEIEDRMHAGTPLESLESSLLTFINACERLTSDPE